MDNHTSERFLRKGQARQFRRGGSNLPALDQNGLPPECFDSKSQIAQGLHRYLLEGWRALPAARVSALGVNPDRDDCLEEDGLTYLAWVLLDCANLTLEQAMAAKRARLRATDLKK